MKKTSDPQHLQSIFPELVKRLGLERRTQEFSVLSLWAVVLSEILSADLLEKTEAVKLKQVGQKRQLLVRVEDAALASELMFHRTALLSKINAYTPQTGLRIDEIVLRVGKV